MFIINEQKKTTEFRFNEEVVERELNWEGGTHHYREIPRRVKTAVARESCFQVYGDQQVQDRIEHQHEHYVRDAHLVVRRHRYRDIFPRQTAADSFEHDETLEYVS